MNSQLACKRAQVDYAGKARFGHGIPTVGGRTHIAVATKENGIEFLNEPQLTHRYVRMHARLMLGGMIT